MEMERRDFLKLAAGALTYSLTTEPAWAQTSKVEVHWLGQSATKLTSLTGKVIVIDPFLTGNPKTPQQYKNLDSLGKVDVILVTHGHPDHTGDVKDLAARTGATVLGPGGLIATMIDLAWVTPEKAVRFGKGGRVNPLGPQITITQVRATKEMLRPKFAIPFHYGTSPVLRGTPQEYQAALGQTTTQVFPISPGDKLTF